MICSIRRLHSKKDPDHPEGAGLKGPDHSQFHQLEDRQKGIEDAAPIGALVTFRYQELSDGGVPRFPVYVGVRDDVAWPPDPDAQVKSSSPRARAAAKAGVGAGDAEDGEVAVAAPPAKATDKPSAGRLAPSAAKAASEAKPAPRPASKPATAERPASKPSPAKAAAPKPAASEAAPADGSPGAPTSGVHRYLEYEEGTSSKFWEVRQEGKELYIRFGKIGSKGQLRLKTFRDPRGAESEARQMIAEKLRKGYVEVRKTQG